MKDEHCALVTIVTILQKLKVMMLWERAGHRITHSSDGGKLQTQIPRSAVCLTPLTRPLIGAGKSFMPLNVQLSQTTCFFNTVFFKSKYLLYSNTCTLVPRQ